MLDHPAPARRRLIRRRRHASPWQRALSWLDLVGVEPRRAPLHALILSVGVVVALIASLGNRSTVAPATETAPPGDALEAEEPVQPVEAVAASPTSEAAPRLTTYVVEPGDSLRSLAERFGVSVATIVDANKLTDPDLINVGQELVMLPTTGVLHTINAGETLGELAQRYGVDTSQLASTNQVAPLSDQPVVGQKLVVPGIEPELPAPKPRTTVEQAEVPSQAEGGQRVTSFASLNTQPDEAATEKPAARSKSPLAYEVQEGDTVRSLATQFGVSIKTILLANNLDDPDLIRPGTKLKVLPVSGVEHEVGKGQSLADIAAAYKVDMGPIIDFNGLSDPDVIRVGDTVVIPGVTTKVEVLTAAPATAQAPPSSPAFSSAPAPAVAAKPAVQPAAQPAAQAAARVAPKPAAQAASPAIAAPVPAPAPAAVAPVPVASGGGGGIASLAMKYVGYRYVFGGSSPAGFDCSGFVYYVHKAAGINISRGMWGQLNGGPRISRENLQPGDIVFFANTYMPGLSHNGIYLGGGQFIHAIDPGSGVGITSMNSSYWAGRYVGATRIR